MIENDILGTKDEMKLGDEARDFVRSTR